MSEQQSVFIVVTEEFYGSNQLRVFSNLDSAKEYQQKVIDYYRGKVDVIVLEQYLDDDKELTEGPFVYH